MIKQAIIPLAGLGTRLLPITSVFAKELLPINGKPGIQYILDECIEAGIKEIILIISNKKEIIRKYFYNDKFYQSIIKKKKDFSTYPRNFKKDIEILKKNNVEYLFMPNTKEIYEKKNKKFNLKKSEKILCAKYRPGHFEGVLNVMDRLLTLIRSKHIFMGEKDFQQYFLIKKILGKKYKVNIIGHPIIRDKNKVALSTRNKLLNKKSIYITSCIAKRLINLKKNFKIKKFKIPINLLKIKSDFEKNYKVKVDYLEFRDEKNLKLNNFKSKYRLFIAYYINNIRLIDNF